MSARGKNLGDVIVNRKGNDHHDTDEAHLEHCFFDIQAEIALHHHFNQQHDNDSAVQNRNGQQIEDRQVEAHHAH